MHEKGRCEGLALHLYAVVVDFEGIVGITVGVDLEAAAVGTLDLLSHVEDVEGVLGVAFTQNLETAARGVGDELTAIVSTEGILGIAVGEDLEAAYRGLLELVAEIVNIEGITSVAVAQVLERRRVGTLDIAPVEVDAGVGDEVFGMVGASVVVVVVVTATVHGFARADVIVAATGVNLPLLWMTSVANEAEGAWIDEAEQLSVEVDVGAVLGISVTENLERAGVGLWNDLAIEHCLIASDAVEGLVSLSTQGGGEGDEHHGHHCLAKVCHHNRTVFWFPSAKIGIFCLHAK